MAHNILILGASYGSLLGTKLLMAGHNVTLVCREATAKLINEQGTEVRIRLKGEETHRGFRSLELAGRLDAQTPENVAVGAYDMVGLAMQEPQYADPSLRELLARIADGKFYIICPDNDVTEEMDRKRLAWAAGDILERDVPLSRWEQTGKYKQEFAEYMERP